MNNDRQHSEFNLRPVELRAESYVLRAGKRFGPFSLETLREHLRIGQLRTDDQVWLPTRNAWVPAAELTLPADRAQTQSSATKSGEGKAPERSSPPILRRAPVIYAALVVIELCLSLTSCLRFIDGGKASPDVYTLHGEQHDVLRLDVDIVKVDLLKGELQLRIRPSVWGKLAFGTQQSAPDLQKISRRDWPPPARDIDLHIRALEGTKLVSFKRQRQMVSFHVDTRLTEGRIALYPLDAYQGQIRVEATSPSSTPGEKADSIPVVIHLKQLDEAVRVTQELAGKTAFAEARLMLTVKRPLPIVVFTWFMVGVAAFLALTVVVVVISVISGRRKAELGMLGWMSALLFALPALRNSLPGAPPLGALIDYSAFFWAEALVGLSTMMVVAMWFSHRESDE